MSRATFGSISLKNQSFVELFDSTNAGSIKLTPPSSVGTNTTLTLPVVASDTIVARTTTDTLTNKSISGSTNTLTNISLTTAVTGTLPVANGGSGVTTSTGTGSNVLSTSPTLVTPVLGTPTSVTLTNATGLPLTSGVTGQLPIANGGTGQATASAAFAALSPLTTAGDIIIESATPAPVRLGIGSTGQVLTVVSGLPAWVTPGTAESTFKYTWVTADTATVAITHSLATTDISVTIFDIASGADISIDSIVRTSTNILTLTASSAPPAGSWRVLITTV